MFPKYLKVTKRLKTAGSLFTHHPLPPAQYRCSHITPCRPHCIAVHTSAPAARTVSLLFRHSSWRFLSRLSWKMLYFRRATFRNQENGKKWKNGEIREKRRNEKAYCTICSTAVALLSVLMNCTPPPRLWHNRLVLLAEGTLQILWYAAVEMCLLTNPYIDAIDVTSI